MFSDLPKAVLMAVWCACAASAAASRNGTPGARTFAFFNPSATDEPLDPFYLDDDVTELRGSRLPKKSGAGQAEISEEALLFLTGTMSTVLMPSFYTLVCLFSVPVNLCAVVAFGLRIRPKKPAAIYMLNLALADLLFAAVLPFKIIYHFLGNHWVFGPAMCRVVTAAFYWNMYCSALLIACISVDRLVAVVYPIDSLSWRRPRNATVACVAMWLLSFAGCVPLVLANQTVHLGQLNVTTCHDVQAAGEVIWHYRIYFTALCCALFFLPLLVTAVSYARVIWTLTRVPCGVLGRSRRKNRAVVMALTVLVIFVLCFAPTNCLLLAHYLQFDESVRTIRDTPDGSYAAYLVFVCLGSLNCLLDPLVYYFGSSQCQRQLSSALRCQKTSGGSSMRTSSDSNRSSTRAILKSSGTQSSKILHPMSKTDPFHGNLSDQYKNLLV